LRQIEGECDLREAFIPVFVVAAHKLGDGCFYYPIGFLNWFAMQSIKRCFPVLYPAVPQEFGKALTHKLPAIIRHTGLGQPWCKITSCLILSVKLALVAFLIAASSTHLVRRF
jgi:hypothetical protein